MPVVRISEAIFARLQSLAIPLVDTPANVIEKLLDYYEASLKKATMSKSQGDTKQQSNSAVVRFPTDVPPDLTYSEVIEGDFAGRKILDWADLGREAHTYAFDELGSFEALRAASISRIFPGKYQRKGFHHIPKVDISLRNVEANRAWPNALCLARKLKVPVRVRVKLRDGQQGDLFWHPSEGLPKDNFDHME